jgi:hypothetical protein
MGAVSCDEKAGCGDFQSPFTVPEVSNLPMTKRYTTAPFQSTGRGSWAFLQLLIFRPDGANQGVGLSQVRQLQVRKLEVPDSRVILPVTAERR